MGKIRIVSMGPGNIDNMTWEAVQALYCADVLIGAEKYAELYPEYGILVPDKLVSGTIELIKANIDKNVSIMVTGDSGFYSLGKSIIKEFGCEKVTVIPGVSIVQMAFARLCEPWHDAVFFSVHGRDADIEIHGDKFMVLCDNTNRASEIISRHIKFIETHDIYAMEGLSMPEEKITKINSADDLSKLTGNSLSVVIGIRR